MTVLINHHCGTIWFIQTCAGSWDSFLNYGCMIDLQLLVPELFPIVFRAGIKRWGQWIFPRCYERAPPPPPPPATFIGKYIRCRRKIESKEISSCLIPRLPVVFTWQLEILETALAFHSCGYLWKTDTIIFADLNKSPRPQTLLKMRLT